MAASSTGTSSSRPPAHVSEGWKHGGLLKVQGIPSPTGSMEVGCVDVMHRFPDDDRGLLVRLFYPTQPGLAGTHQYARWTPNHRYIKGYLDYLQPPKSPALCDAPLHRGKAQSENTQPQSSTTQSSSVKPEAQSTTEPDMQSDEMQSAPELEVHPTAGDRNEQPEASDSERSSSLSEQFPVIVFSHGMAGMRTTYSAICCDLASHGYVVASVEHRDQSACLSLSRVPVGTVRDGQQQQYRDDWIPFYFLPKEEPEFPIRHKQVKQRSSEVQKALDLLSLLNEGGDIHNMMGGNYDFGQFKGRLKVDVAVVMGHSFGGATTIQALSEDHRFKCGIALDCWMFSIHRDLYEVGVAQPLLFINSHTFQWAENVRCMMNLVKPVGLDGISRCQLLTISGTVHVSQSDTPFVLADAFQSEQPPPIDANVAHSVNMDVCHAFLKRFFWEDPTHQQPVPNLDGGEGASEHLIFGTNVDWQENSGGDAKDNLDAKREGGAEGVINETGEIVPIENQADPIPNGSSVVSADGEEQKEGTTGLEQKEEDNIPETAEVVSAGAGNKQEEEEGRDDAAAEEQKDD